MSKKLETFFLASAAVFAAVGGEVNVFPDGNFENQKIVHRKIGTVRGSAGYDSEHAAEGRYSLKVASFEPGNVRGYSGQVISLNQTRPVPLTITYKGMRQGTGKTLAAVDLVVTYDNGQRTYFFRGLELTGDTNGKWIAKKAVFTPARPIKTIEVWPIVNGDPCTAWFDDIRVMTDRGAVEAAAVRETVLDNGKIRMVFGDFGKVFNLVELENLLGKNFFVRKSERRMPDHLWSIRFRLPGNKIVAVEQGKISEISEAQNKHFFLWNDLPIPDSPGRFSVKVTLDLSDDLARWYIEVESSEDIFDVAFPRLNGIGPLGRHGHDDVAVIPDRSGVLMRDYSRIGTVNLTYGAGCSMQFFAFYDRHGGMYAATHDASMLAKNFQLSRQLDNSLNFAVSTIPGLCRSYRQPFPFVMRFFDGDWFDAAQIYREWATEQSWCRDAGRLVDRKNPLVDGIHAWIKGGAINAEPYMYPVKTAAAIDRLTPEERLRHSGSIAADATARELLRLADAIGRNSTAVWFTDNWNTLAAKFSSGTYGIIIDKTTGEFTDVGDVGHGIQRTMQSAVCDWRTGKMYWAGPMNDGKDHSRDGNRYGTALYEVNIETGASTLLSRFPYKETVVGMYVVGDIVKKNYDVNIKLSSPSQLNANELASAVATVKNLGTSVAKGYTVKLYANDVVRATVENGMELQPGESVDLDLDFVANVSDGTRLSLYATVEMANDENETNNISTTTNVIVVQSTLPTVSLMGMEENGFVTLAWDAPSLDNRKVTEDFERYAPFIISNIGDWTTVKRDDAQATATMRDFMGSYEYPNAGRAFAYQVFNPSEAGIYKDNYEADTCTYYCQSGKQMLIAMAGAVPADNTSGYEWAKADNWLISPELSGKAQTIAFYAKCWTSQVKQYVSSGYTHYDEQFHVLYSTTDTNPENFTRLNADTIVAKQRFKEGDFLFELPEGAKYFAIQHVTDGETGFCFFLDDISYQPVIAHIKGYNVYCNGVKLTEEPLSANTTDYTIATQGEEVNSFSVSVVYEEGESMASNAFNAIPAAINDLRSDRLHKTGIYTLNGPYIGTQLPAVRGLYVVRLSDGQTQKVIVK